MGTAAQTSALECKVGLGRILVPANYVSAVGECVMGAPFATAQRVHISLAQWNDDIAVGIALTRPAVGPSRTSIAVLVDRRQLGSTKGSAPFLIEIVGAVGLVDVENVGDERAGGFSWMRTAVLNDGRTMQFVDVARLVADLGAVGGLR